MSKMRKEYDPNKVKRRKRKPIVYITVSYTHLTLPTKRIV